MSKKLVFVAFEKRYLFDKPAGQMLWNAYGITPGRHKRWLCCRPTESREFSIDSDILRFKSYDWYQPTEKG